MGRKPKTDRMPENSNPSLETAKPKPKMHKNAAGLSSRKNASKEKNVFVRRSGRLQNLVPHTQNQEIETVVQEINLIESEREDEPHVDQYTPEPTLDESSLEKKIDHLLQIVEELKSKETKRRSASESPHTDLKYKSMYIDSQKKIEALTNENYELGKKLEIALGKLEVIEALTNENRELGKKLEIALGKLELYDNVKEVMEKLKDLILISNLVKFGDFSSLNAVAEPGGAVEPQDCAAKRKRLTKGSKRN